MNILLHICCAPCAIYPVDLLRKEAHQIAGLFYNPNIHPYSEFLKREAEVRKWAEESALNVICGDYDIERWFDRVDFNGSRERRCPACWWMRMEKAGELAKENGFEAFTTTLLGSPYQDRAVIKSIGEDVAKRLELKFFDADFGKGFREAHDIARSKGIYCQNYCGCLFSEKERLEEKAGRRNKGGREASKPAGPSITLSVKGSKKKIKCSM
jgi:predicted adenine nucleotide alpha hydrolase (AANH) superfamily ATPase